MYDDPFQAQHAAPAGDRLSLAWLDESTVVVSGEIDASVSPMLEGILCAHLEDRAVSADLSGVTFIDASGVRALVAVRLRSLETGREFRLERHSAATARLLDLTGSSAIFLDEAVPFAS